MRVKWHEWSHAYGDTIPASLEKRGEYMGAVSHKGYVNAVVVKDDGKFTYVELGRLERDDGLQDSSD